MKTVFFLLASILSLNAFTQRYEFLGDIPLDGSYSILGMGQRYDKSADSLERFWFILDKREDILKLKSQLPFKKSAPTVSFDKNCIDMMVIKNKKIVKTEGELFPLQKKFVSNGKGWYFFDTAVLVKLHAEHPLKYHAQKYIFDTYLSYIFFQDSISSEPTVLYLDEPALKYEGKFYVVMDKDTETSSPVFSEKDLKKELVSLSPESRFNTYAVLNDTFNTKHKNKVKIVVESSKALYDKYSNPQHTKGVWQPNLIEATVYTRD